MKLKAKKKAAAFLKTRCGIDVQPTAMFDIQARVVRPPAILCSQSRWRSIGSSMALLVSILCLSMSTEC